MFVKDELELHLHFVNRKYNISLHIGETLSPIFLFMYNIIVKTYFWAYLRAYGYFWAYLRAYGVMISMFRFHRSVRGSNPGRDFIVINTTLKCLASTQRLILRRWATGYQFSYWDQIVETQGHGVAPSPTIW